MLFIATGGRHNALITFLTFHDHRLILFTNCLEEVFSETGLPVYGILGNPHSPGPIGVPDRS
jgi:hypothetical protein